jgi:hypothetical protein
MLQEGEMTAEVGHVGAHTFLSSGDVEWFADFGRRLLGPELSTASRWRQASSD